MDYYNFFLKWKFAAMTPIVVHTLFFDVFGNALKFKLIILELIWKSPAEIEFAMK